jgi:hypothetical protein
MAINIENETLVTLTEAAKLLPRISQNKVHVSTLWRWCHIGLWGVYLEYLYVGGRITTSLEALQRFFIALTENSHRTKKSSCLKNRRHLSDAARQRSIDEANAILVRAGIARPSARREAVTV